MAAGRFGWLPGWHHQLIGAAVFSLLAATSASAQITNTFPQNGNLGIGTTSPFTSVHARGSNPYLTLENTSNQGAGYWSKNTIQQWYFGLLDNMGITRFSLYDNTSNKEQLTILSNSGNVGIGTGAPAAKLHVAGNVQVDGNIAAKYQDVAEWVRTGEALAPGTVVAIDTQDSDRVVTSSKPYDTAVAGVVSPRPGLVLGEAGPDKALVAHSGRVRVKVDAKYGAVSRGDLLVASPTPGFAMRSEPKIIDGVRVHMPGTLIGKALEPLNEGQAEILVLLTLQ
jgi:hypothetical protein